MFIEDVTKDKTNIGSVIDNLTNDQFEIWIKKCGPLRDHPEYKIDLKISGEDRTEVGYLRFVPGLEGEGDYTLSALKVGEEFRGKKLADGLIETLFQYAELNQSTFLSAVQQRKPLTAFILQKYGLHPLNNRARDQVDIMGRFGENALLVAFVDPNKRGDFERSNICTQSKQYKSVDLNPHLVKDTVTLLTPYLLIDEDKCSQRRETTQARFTISFNYQN